jgi:hypothetical protein
MSRRLPNFSEDFRVAIARAERTLASIAEAIQDLRLERPVGEGTIAFAEWQEELQTLNRQRIHMRQHLRYLMERQRRRQPLEWSHRSYRPHRRRER